MASTALLQLARTQFGAVHRRQLVDDLQLSKRQIGGLLGRGELIELLPSTYRLASHPDTFVLRALAAQLWADGVGFISSWSAARVHGLRKMESNPVHFTVPASFSRRTPDWIHLDRTGWYDATADRVTLSSGLVVATPERMLFGLASDLTAFRFTRAVEDAWHLELITPDALSNYLEQHRCRGKNGVTRIERWVERHGDRARPAQSHLEMTFIEAFERVGLPTPERQHPLTITGGAVIHLDIAWPDLQLAVEPGSSWFHGGDAGQSRDHDRDLACNELGWSVIRLDESFAADPNAAARRVQRTYRRRAIEISASGR